MWLLTNGDTDMQTGEILGASLEQIQLEIGIGSAVTESSVALYGHLTTYGWWTNLWEFVSDKNILLCQEDPIIPPLQHEDDQYVMERIISHTPRSKADIRIFNQCQIKMQVVMMADIIHADGIMLMDQMTSYSPDTVNMSKYDWPCKELHLRMKLSHMMRNLGHGLMNHTNIGNGLTHLCYIPSTKAMMSYGMHSF